MASRISSRRRDLGDCYNCRRRTIPCDRSYPTCDQCLRRGLHCRTLLSRSGGAVWRSGAPAQSSVTGTVIDGSAASSGTSDASPRTSSHHTQSPSDAQISATADTDLSLPASLNMSAFQDDFQYSWLLHHYLHRPILHELISLSMSNNLGEAALVAAKFMSATLFAKFHKLLPIEATSLPQTPYCKEYSDAINALRKQISSFRSDHLEEILVPALLLFLTEIWVAGRSQMHYAGLEQLLKVSRQSILQARRLGLFHEVRLAMVWYALSRGKRTIFAEESWKIAPLTATHSPKSSSHCLVEYMADISDLFADTEKVEPTSQDGSSSGPSYRARARAILHQLYSWRWSWEAQNPDSVSLETTHAAEVFGTSLNFNHPQLLYEIWLYDALLILVLRFLYEPHHTSQSQDSIRPTGTLIMPDQVRSVQQPAIEICRSLDYQMLHLAYPAPIHEWALPLALAYVTLPSTSPIRAWVLSKIATAPLRVSVPWSLYIERLNCRDVAHSWDVMHLNGMTEDV